MSKADGTEAYRIFNARKVVVWFAESSVSLAYGEDCAYFHHAIELFVSNVKVINAGQTTTTLLRGLKLNTEVGRLKAARRLATVAVSHLLYDDDPQEVVIVVYPASEGERESHVRLARKMVEDEGLAFVDWMGR